MTPVNIDPLGDLNRIGEFDAHLAPFDHTPIGHPPFLVLTEAILKGENFFRLAPSFNCFDKYSLQLPKEKGVLGPNKKSFFSIDLNFGSSTVSRIETAYDGRERVVDTAFIFSPFPNVTYLQDRTQNLKPLWFSAENIVGEPKPKRPWWKMNCGKDPVDEIFPLPFYLEYEGQKPVANLQVQRWEKDEIELLCDVKAGVVRYLNFFQPQQALPYDVKFEVDWSRGATSIVLIKEGKQLILRCPLQQRPERIHVFPLLQSFSNVVFGNVLLMVYQDHCDLFLDWGNFVTLYLKLDLNGGVIFHRATDGKFDSTGTFISPRSTVMDSMREAIAALRSSVARETPTDKLLKGIWHAFDIE